MDQIIELEPRKPTIQNSKTIIGPNAVLKDTILDDTTECGAKSHSFTSKLPCAKFIIASAVSIASFGLGCTMLIILPPSHALIPFYSSLISGCLSYWVQPPSYNEKK